MTKVPKFLIYIFIIVSICSAFALWIRVDSGNVDRQNQEDVVSAFAHSLRSNDEQRAKSLVSMEKWKEIEFWNNQHEAVLCKQSLDSAGSSEWIVKNPDKESYSIFLDLGCSEYPFRYYLIVLDINLINSEEGWTISNWTPACEGSNNHYPDECSDRFYERAFPSSD